jgi:hypothetical protein
MTIKSAALTELILDESKRQDGLMHEWSSSLGTKTALYMVFVAFIFSAETAFLQLAKGPIAAAALSLAMFFSLLAVIPLLFASFLYRYRKPPRPERFRQQCIEYYDSLTRLTEDERVLRIKGKLINSFSRCVDENYGLNERIANNLRLSSVLICVAVILLLILAIAIFVPRA